jgi:hypothetical protein
MSLTILLRGRGWRRGRAEASFAEAIGEARAQIAARGGIELHCLAPAAGGLRAGEGLSTTRARFFDNGHRRH